MLEQFGRAICYSGYRKGQDPRTETYPSYEQVKQDLLILANDWDYIRLYDCSTHAKTVLEVIKHEGLALKVLLGADLGAEINNPNCPWGGVYPDHQLAENTSRNQKNIATLIAFANAYPETVQALSIGNEASVDWNDHMVSVDALVAYAKQVKAGAKQPVSFCENYVPWLGKLEPLVEVVDFICIHTYPAWEYKTLRDALAYTQQNYYAVADRYPHKKVVITEAGWTTRSNNRGIERWNASEEIQAEYIRQLLRWTGSEEILTFVFEAFDEPWKGSDDASEPEKHWGLYFEDRTPKLVITQR
ncbi:glycosyl hydrolase family 17 protein [Thalassotalea aquiviva]|uniref:glycosyl hydrolase family 17 protein n=1 Tax=Thalassotalea aquiviva TaxID=3242415 RepID=UPI00352B9D40